jgi:hypothetical protein
MLKEYWVQFVARPAFIKQSDAKRVEITPNNVGLKVWRQRLTPDYLKD